MRGGAADGAPARYGRPDSRLRGLPVSEHHEVESALSAQTTADVHALLTDEYVAVANRGRPFSREGLRAVCQAHLSPKVRSQATPISDEKDAERFLGEIRKQRLAAYRSCPSDLAEHAGSEEVLRSEYAGRILPELLQNAHDAIAPKPIGSKGVGFKAVLNVCDGPRIHSGPLHCGFDRERSRREFQDAGLLNGNGSAPLMRLPFTVSEADEPQPVLDLIANYDTVVVLPFKGQNAPQRFLDEWSEYAVNASLLLFLPGVGRIIWERRDGTDTSAQSWRYERQAAATEIYEGDDTVAKEQWRLWSSERASIALWLDGNGTPVQDQGYPSIRVYFETDERSPLPLLIHADFPLKEGRYNVLVDDETSRADIRQVMQEVARRVRAALAAVHDGGLLLDLLRPRVESEQMGRLEAQLWKAFRTALASLEIPGAHGLRLDQVRLRPTDESLQASWWLFFDCDLWNAFKSVLANHRVGRLKGLPVLPPGIDTKLREETILHFNPEARLTVEELRHLPLLPVEGSDKPVAPDTSNVFFPPSETPPSPPEGIDVRFLDHQFIAVIENRDDSDNIRRLLIEVLGVSEFKPLTLIEKAVLPILRNDTQPNGLIEFLCRVIVPALREEDLIFDWHNPVRKEFAERMLVSVRGGTTLPAVQVYAGADWTGTDFLERAYSRLNHRGFLDPPPGESKNRNQLEKLYRWIGVGWFPKVLPVVYFEAKRGTGEGPHWVNGIFPVTTPPEHWREYCTQFNHFDNQARKARLRQDWTLDGGSDVLMADDAFSFVNANWPYYSKYIHSVFYRSSNLKEDYDNESRRAPSHLNWLFHTSSWIPAKGIPQKQKSDDVFARPEIVRELGGWAYELDGKADQELLDAIGVRSGWRQLDDADWCRWLERATGLSDEKLNHVHGMKRSVYRLYEAALRHWSGKDGYPPQPPGEWSGPVWCVERRADNTETWRVSQGRDGVYYVDHADLDELRIPELWVFPVRLNRLEGAATERFGLKLLSEHLSGQPEPAAPVDSAAGQVHKRIEDRLPAINAYLETAFRENSPRLEPPKLPSIMVVQDLNVEFSLDDGSLSNTERRDAYFSRVRGGCTLWLDSALFNGDGNPTTSVWEYAASTLVYAGDLDLDLQPCLKDLLLYEGADLERKLLSLGVTKETIDRITHKDPVIPKPGAVPQPKPGGDPPPKSTGNDPPIPPSPPNGGGGPGGGGGGPGGGGRPPGTSTQQPGREAQEWMRDELRKRLKPEDWRISGAPTHDEQLRETDIELHHDQFGTFHVEVKHCETSHFYWSENEVGKAKQNVGRYVIVILTRGKNNLFDEYWFNNPLEDFKELPRTGVWEWRGRQDGVDLFHIAAPWLVPAPKPERKASFSFRVEIERDWLKNHGQSFKSVRALFLIRQGVNP